jgi:hypothetical protein
MTEMGFPVVAATLAAGAIVILPGLSRTAEAGTVAAKGDRLNLTLRNGSIMPAARRALRPDLRQALWPASAAGDD